jgi:hypothetical protein
MLKKKRAPSLSDRPFCFQERSSFPIAMHSSGFQPEKLTWLMPTIRASRVLSHPLVSLATHCASVADPPKASRPLMYLIRHQSKENKLDVSPLE